MSENKDNKLTLINEKTANDYLTHTNEQKCLLGSLLYGILAVERLVSSAVAK